MKLILFSAILSLMFSAFAMAQQGEINIIPQPKSVTRSKGEFELNYKTKIVAGDAAGQHTAGILNDLLMKNYGFKLEYVFQPAKIPDNAIVFEGQEGTVITQPEEGYTLRIMPKRISIFGSTGQFYALQSLMQLLPVEFKGKAKIPAVVIIDAPRFGYRGMHLDVARHFFSVSFVKKFIDLMAQYKFNRFHWHLTDDQGWRVEIKKYPRLTEIGSRRSESHLGRYSTTFKGDGKPVEGFYTQDEIKDVIAYAKDRKIIVIPEIELPGHASAALSAYPEFGCKENYDYQVKKTWGIFKEVFCPTDKTFQFLEDILSEVITLFPESPYIHIGADEVLKDHWKESAFVQDLMKRENLKDEHEVQSYFVRRIEKFINSKGKRMIGWDEILEGGVAPNATVMSWRGEKGGIESAKAKHDVIMTPNTYLYFDYGQGGDPKYELLNIGGSLPLEKVYSYDPIPKELAEDEKKYILGAQANLWTEYIETPDKAEYMVVTRMLALSEVDWSPVEKKNYADFLRRFAYQAARLDKQNINYRIPEPKGLKNTVISGTDKARIELQSVIPNSKIYYTLDGSEPTVNSKLYDKSIEIPLKEHEQVELKTIVVTEKGRKSVIYPATIVNKKTLEPVELKDKKDGVNLRFYKGSFVSVKDFDKTTPTEAGETRSIGLNQFADKTDKLKTPFGAMFDGFLYVAADGLYEFELTADDGAVLQIGSETIDLDGVHSGAATKSGVVSLKAGYHKFTLRYFQANDNAALNLRWGIKGGVLQGVPANVLFH